MGNITDFTYISVEIMILTQPTELPQNKQQKLIESKFKRYFAGRNSRLIRITQFQQSEAKSDWHPCIEIP